MLHNDAIGDPDDGQGVVIRRREVDGRMVAGYQNLMTCGSVWACPRCSAVVAHTRAAEIGAAVQECYRQGGRVQLLTLTMRHSSRQSLEELWNALSTAWRATFGTRAWTGQKSRTALRRGKLVEIGEVIGDAGRFDIAGLTRVVEATYGKPELDGHGWHLHIHALVFSVGSLVSGLDSLELVQKDKKQEAVQHLGPIVDVVSALFGDRVDWEWLARNVFAARIFERWSNGLEKSGCGPAGAVAVDVREVSDGGADYVGRYLSKATYDIAIGMEMAAGSTTKEARTTRNRTPFELLAELADSLDTRGFGVRTPRHWSVVAGPDGDWAVIDADTGQVMNVTSPGGWRVWHEWEQASKGRRQIIWSRRRRDPVSRREILWNSVLDARGLTADEIDEAIAAADVNGEVVGEISRADWYRVVVWRPELIVVLLEAAEQGGAQSVERALSGMGVALKRPPPLVLVAA